MEAEENQVGAQFPIHPLNHPLMTNWGQMVPKHLRFLPCFRTHTSSLQLPPQEGMKFKHSCLALVAGEDV